MVKRNDRWSALSMKERADLIKLYVSNGITSLSDIKKYYNSFGPGGYIERDEYGYPADITPAVVTQDSEFNKFLITLPDNQRLTPEEEYHTYQYWKINGKPKDFSEALNLEMYHYDSSDSSYHANSVAFDDKGVGHFMKPKHHPTVKYELDWYNKGISTLEGGEQYPLQGEERKEWEDFRKEYQLDSTGVDYKYVPRKHYNSFGDGGDKNSFDFENSFDLLIQSNKEGVSIPYNPEYISGEDQKALDEAVETDRRLDIKFLVPNQDSERVFTSKVNNYVETSSKIDLLKSLNDKSRDEVIKIQQDLANEGYYDISIDRGKNKNSTIVQKQLVQEGYLKREDVDGNLGNKSIEALQQMLVDKGYMPETTEYGKSNIDGIIGKRTREAYKKYNRDYNVDGIVGERTKKGFLQKESFKTNGFDSYVSAEGMIDQCAAWVSKKYDNITGAGKQNGVFGNAWNMLTNIEDAGGKMLFNIYDSPLFDGVTSASQIKNVTNQILKNSNLDYTQLLEGDVVGIYNPSSTHYKDVLDSGTTYNTHVGIVVDIENGVPIVEHNILGKVRRERIDKLSGSSYGKPVVTVASRPKQGEVVQELSFKNVKSKYSLPEGKENPLMREYMDSLASAKETFKNIFDNVDLDFIEEAAIAITKRETNFMTNKPSDNKFKPTFIARNLAHFIRQTPEEIKSQDLTKMKFNSLSPSYRASIGLSSPEQLSEDPTITGRAVMLLLSKNYDYFTRLAKQNPELGLTKEDIENATILSYNRGLGQTHTMGFNKDGSLNIEELKYLRDSSKLDAKEKDISATNYKYLGSFGELLYNKFGDPYTPYISSARRAMLTLKKSK